MTDRPASPRPALKPAETAGPSAHPQPLLEAAGLSYRLGGRALLDGVSLHLRAGEVVAVLGPNGAGKSTLVRLLLGLARAEAGEVRVRGAVLARPDDAVARGVVGLLQRSPLFAGTVAHNVGYGLRLRGVPEPERATRVRAALQRLGVAGLGGRDVRTLSGGEAQRVAIARATVLEPEVLVLDEPGADLDIASRRQLLADLESAVRHGGRGTLLITHDPHEAFALADRIYVLEGGRVSQQGAPADIVADPASPFIAALTGAELVVDGVVAGAREGLVEVDVGGLRWLAVPGPGEPGDWTPGRPVHLAYRPEDVALAPAGRRELASPRNRVDARVASMAPQGGLVRVRLDGPVPLVALLTREGAAELGLAPGAAVRALLKAVAMRAYMAPPPGPA